MVLAATTVQSVESVSQSDGTWEEGALVSSLCIETNNAKMVKTKDGNFYTNYLIRGHLSFEKLSYYWLFAWMLNVIKGRKHIFLCDFKLYTAKCQC